MMVDGWNFLHKFLHHLVILCLAWGSEPLYKWPSNAPGSKRSGFESPGIWEKKLHHKQRGNCFFNRNFPQPLYWKERCSKFSHSFEMFSHSAKRTFIFLLNIRNPQKVFQPPSPSLKLTVSNFPKMDGWNIRSFSFLVASLKVLFSRAPTRCFPKFQRCHGSGDGFF